MLCSSFNYRKAMKCFNSGLSGWAVAKSGHYIIVTLLSVHVDGVHVSKLELTLLLGSKLADI